MNADFGMDLDIRKSTSGSVSLPTVLLSGNSEVNLESV